MLHAGLTEGAKSAVRITSLGVQAMCALELRARHTRRACPFMRTADVYVSKKMERSAVFVESTSAGKSAPLPYPEISS